MRNCKLCKERLKWHELNYHGFCKFMKNRFIAGQRIDKWSREFNNKVDKEEKE